MSSLWRLTVKCLLFRAKKLHLEIIDLSSLVSLNTRQHALCGLSNEQPGLIEIYWTG